MRLALFAAGCAYAVISSAQDIAPIMTDLDRFVVFDRGRFKEIEPRRPLHLVVAGDRIVYTDDRGALKVYADGKATTVNGARADTLLGSNVQVMLLDGTRSGIVRATGPLMLSEDAGDVSVSDSLVAWHDRGTGSLNVCWRNTIFPVADIARDSERPQWQLGRNTFTCYDHAARKILMFYRGKLDVLCDSSDVGRVSCGGDIVAYFDGGEQRFCAMERGGRVVLEEVPPIDFKAGDGLIAYNDVTLAFKVHQRGGTHRVLDHMPTQYWVRDSTIVFVDGGMLWTVEQGEAVVIEEYVPEQWSIHQGTIVYLDLNREIRSFQHGHRDLLSREARIARFDHFGNTVRYRNEQGFIKVAWKGRVYEY